ncbi:MAG: hypothetical protein U9N33_06550 [Campylobacterota bacterium]|nr:hypothetical protein [Campylobacterota bacterium]
MRSRDGNRTFLLKLFSLILLTSLALSASEYLVSYRYIVKNALLYNDTLDISDSMKPCFGIPQEELILQNNSNNDFRKIISTNSQEFIDYMHKLGLHVESLDITKDYQTKSTTILTLKTTCFKVDFNDTFARITPLK